MREPQPLENTRVSIIAQQEPLALWPTPRARGFSKTRQRLNGRHSEVSRCCVLRSGKGRDRETVGIFFSLKTFPRRERQSVVARTGSAGVLGILRKMATDSRSKRPGAAKVCCPRILAMTMFDAAQWRLTGLPWQCSCQIPRRARRDHRSIVRDLRKMSGFREEEDHHDRAVWPPTRETRLCTARSRGDGRY